MQYYQLRYIIKTLLLNGLFVLFSHAMDFPDGVENEFKNEVQVSSNGVDLFEDEDEDEDHSFEDKFQLSNFLLAQMSPVAFDLLNNSSASDPFQIDYKTIDDQNLHLREKKKRLKNE